MIVHNRPSLGKEEEKASGRVLSSGWIAQGKEVECFENELCKYLGLPEGHAVAVSSGTASLFLALWALSAQGKEVAFPAYVCSSVRHSVAMAQAQEVLVDCREDFPVMNMDTASQVGADIIIAPHIFGAAMDLSAFKDIDIVEDCAQALGAKVDGKSVGLDGKIGIFSFYATKLITSGGQGGMVVSQDKSLVDAVRDYRQFDGRDDDKKRFNFQMTDLQAAIGRVQLKKLPEFLKRRKEIFERYKNAGLPVLEFSQEKTSSVYYRALLVVERSKELIGFLEEQGIKAIIPLEDWELLGDGKLFPSAYGFTQRLVSIPIYPSLLDSEVDHIIEAVKKKL